MSGPFITNPITTASGNITTTQITCRLHKSLLPSFAPVIGSLPVTSSTAGQYSLVYINGNCFHPNGVTYVNFGQYKNIPIVYYGSFNISFVVPLNAPPGNYNVVVVNVYNGQFSVPIKYSYSGNLNYSNSVIYTLT
jgi:hypothetical protein